MTARFAIKVYESRTLTPYSMPAEGVQPLGAYIKLRKNPGNYKRREKIGRNSDALCRIWSVGYWR